MNSHQFFDGSIPERFKEEAMDLNPTTTLVDLGRCPNDEGKLQLWWENTVKVGEFLVWESEVNDGEEKWASIRGKKADWEESSNLKIMT